MDLALKSTGSLLSIASELVASDCLVLTKDVRVILMPLSDSVPVVLIRSLHGEC